MKKIKPEIQIPSYDPRNPHECIKCHRNTPLQTYRPGWKPVRGLGWLVGQGQPEGFWYRCFCGYGWFVPQEIPKSEIDPHKYPRDIADRMMEFVKDEVALSRMTMYQADCLRIWAGEIRKLRS